MKIYRVANVFLDWPLASAMAVVMGVIQAGLVIAYQRAGRGAAPRMRCRRRPRCAARCWSRFVLFITLPLVMVLLEAFGADWFGVRDAAGALDAALVRLGRRRPSISSACCSTPSKSRCWRRCSRSRIAIPGAWAIARYRLPLKSVLIGAILFPRMIPRDHLRARGRAHLLRAPPDQHRSRHRARARHPGGAFRGGGADQHVRRHGPAAAGSRRGVGLRSVAACSGA